jgi:hypothetical protein
MEIMLCWGPKPMLLLPSMLSYSSFSTVSVAVAVTSFGFIFVAGFMN